MSTYDNRVPVEFNDTTIAASGTTTGEINLSASSLVALIVPAMTGTSLSFTVSDAPGGTFVPALDANGNTITVVVGATARYIPLTPSVFGLFGKVIKIVSNGAEASLRTIKVGTRPLL